MSKASDVTRDFCQIGTVWDLSPGPCTRGCIRFGREPTTRRGTFIVPAKARWPIERSTADATSASLRELAETYLHENTVTRRVTENPTIECS